MRQVKIIATTVFGLESIVKEECEKLGFKDIEVENGKVEFTGDQEDLAKANLWLRSAERVLIKLGEFKALTYEDVYQGMKKIDWENYLDEDGKFIVNAKSVKSKLYSPRDLQSIGKKAIVDRLSKEYNKEWFKESDERYSLEISLLKDQATVTLDSSGDGLHKRGYRTAQNEAPMKETLASSLIYLSYWDKTRPLVDLFCGSGTILIEAAMMARNIAPGIDRDFDFVHWKKYDKEIYKRVRAEALNSIDQDVELDILGFDIDRKAIKIARDNAYNAGVDDCIKFVTKDMKEVGLLNNFGVLISNPPYGERIGEKEDLEEIYQSLQGLIYKLSTWSFYIITNEKSLEKKLNRRADRKRKLYNGRIEVDYYQFIGPNPDLLK